MESVIVIILVILLYSGFRPRTHRERHFAAASFLGLFVVLNLVWVHGIKNTSFGVPFTRYAGASILEVDWLAAVANVLVGVGITTLLRRRSLQQPSDRASQGM
ncbi:MAG: hypothetical protein U0793_30500 [Gemmataceae bacterium]